MIRIAKTQKSRSMLNTTPRNARHKPVPTQTTTCQEQNSHAPCAAAGCNRKQNACRLQCVTMAQQKLNTSQTWYMTARGCSEGTVQPSYRTQDSPLTHSLPDRVTTDEQVSCCAHAHVRSVPAQSNCLQIFHLHLQVIRCSAVMHA